MKRSLLLILNHNSNLDEDACYDFCCKTNTDFSHLPGFLQHDDFYCREIYDPNTEYVIKFNTIFNTTLVEMDCLFDDIPA